MMKYNSVGDPIDLEAAYRYIEKAGYGYALEPIREHIVRLEAVVDAADELIASETVSIEALHINWFALKSRCRELRELKEDMAL